MKLFCLCIRFLFGFINICWRFPLSMHWTLFKQHWIYLSLPCRFRTNPHSLLSLPNHLTACSIEQTNKTKWVINICFLQFFVVVLSIGCIQLSAHTHTHTIWKKNFRGLHFMGFAGARYFQTWFLGGCYLSIMLQQK